ncbi:MAG TPA: zinc metalloprotease HtpX [Methanocorpusculum sp.]|nr:zinc metalloprotease HtpX [Methanocorpusculum sp.]HJJ40378.1 zinc metalloprotease HtpX [Methanocorpusculum sp.]HJJ49673.1 zinc metalloprotease HtpX [Methanocorpusculum sp.]HJJ57611.1 zinc metalloprotease HtpX [Methanocorpusculum sp.]HJJ95372.1 zinc metalloprotease HtpX [Methanocorpusculum sp.]
MKWKRDWGLTGRQAIAWIIMLGIYVAIIWVAFRFLTGGWRYLLIGFVFISAFVQFFFSDKIVEKSMQVRIVNEHEEPRLYEIIRNLASEANLPMPKVGIIEHRAMADIPNAFATGRNPRHAVIAVTPKIRAMLSEPELEAVLAHEMSHIKNRDMLTMTIGSFAVMLASVIINNSFIIGILGGMRDNDENGAGIAVYFVVLAVTFVIYIIGTIVTMAISRYREFAADRGSAYLTGHPDSLISALKKISAGVASAPRKAKREVSGNNSFYIIPAISGESVMELFSTHPSLEKRIENLEKVKAEIRGY